MALDCSALPNAELRWAAFAARLTVRAWSHEIVTRQAPLAIDIPPLVISPARLWQSLYDGAEAAYNWIRRIAFRSVTAALGRHHEVFARREVEDFICGEGVNWNP